MILVVMSQHPGKGDNPRDIPQQRHFREGILVDFDGCKKCYGHSWSRDGKEMTDTGSLEGMVT